MLGTVLLLLVVPLVLWGAGEVLARWSGGPWLWLPFGFQPARDSQATRRTRDPYAIGRAPDLPPRLSLHDRSALPTYDPTKGRPGRQDELEA